MRKRAFITHFSKALPAFDIPVYGSLTQSDLPPKYQLGVIICVAFLKAVVVYLDYNGTRRHKRRRIIGSE